MFTSPANDTAWPTFSNADRRNRDRIVELCDSDFALLGCNPVLQFDPGRDIFAFERRDIGCSLVFMS
jgi:hypothetical protein